MAAMYESKNETSDEYLYTRDQDGLVSCPFNQGDLVHCSLFPEIEFWIYLYRLYDCEKRENSDRVCIVRGLRTESGDYKTERHNVLFSSLRLLYRE